MKSDASSERSALPRATGNGARETPERPEETLHGLAPEPVARPPEQSPLPGRVVEDTISRNSGGRAFDPWHLKAHTMPRDLRVELISAKLPVVPEEELYRAGGTEEERAPVPTDAFEEPHQATPSEARRRPTRRLVALFMVPLALGAVFATISVLREPSRALEGPAAQDAMPRFSPPSPAVAARPAASLSVNRSAPGLTAPKSVAPTGPVETPGSGGRASREPLAFGGATLRATIEHAPLVPPTPSEAHPVAPRPRLDLAPTPRPRLEPAPPRATSSALSPKTASEISAPSSEGRLFPPSD